MASGRPILCDFPCPFNPVLEANAGVSVDTAKPEDIADQIEKFTSMDATEIDNFCRNARNAAKEYDFDALTQKLLDTFS